MDGVSLMAYIATSAYAIVWGGFGAGTIAVLVIRAGLLGAEWPPHVTPLISHAVDAACIPWIEGRAATIWVLETGFRGPIDSDCGSGPEGGRSLCDRPASAQRPPSSLFTPMSAVLARGLGFFAAAGG